jgi:hypothetical protein
LFDKVDEAVLGGTAEDQNDGIGVLVAKRLGGR